MAGGVAGRPVHRLRHQPDLSPRSGGCRRRQLDLRNAIGENGTVYLACRPGGSGRVEVPVQGAMRVLDAVAAGDEGLPTGTKVRAPA
jgi:hypothetical protein